MSMLHLNEGVDIRRVLIKYDNHSKGDGDERRHKQSVDTNSTEFNEGVEATKFRRGHKNWKAGNELGQALKEEGETKEPVFKTL